MKYSKERKKVEIGICKTYSEYFALGISGYKMHKIKDNDKYILAIKVRNRLNEDKIKKCFIRSMKNGINDCSLVDESELEAIAIAMSFNVDKTNLKIELNKEVYIKK